MTLAAIILFTFTVVLQGTIASLTVSGDLLRGISSLGAVGIVIVTAYLIRTILIQTPSAALDRVITIISSGFVFIAIVAIAGVQPIQSDYVKPVFPFAEPSHFALSFTPFLIYQCVRSSLPMRIGWLVIALAIAVLLESLSLVVAVGVAAACCLPPAILGAGLVAVSAVAGYLDISYYTDRLDFSSNTTNISTLVYIQGYELTQAALERTGGWGIGFQQLGIVPLNVPTSDLIYRLIQDDANLRDGGLTAAKLIAELGIFGIALVATYLYLAIRAGLGLRALANGKRRGTAHELFALAVITAPLIEVFVRGIGYFSGTLLLMMAGLLMASEGQYLARRRPAAKDAP
ncbi:hypothetical protein ASE59_15065 [Sphingomonas sp. Leaf10]|nr:hypothetical protein ASE59_15065 [Sphingomonas sp. Leaf10]